MFRVPRRALPVVLAATLTVAVFSVSAHAQQPQPPGPFSDVPAGNPVYRNVRTAANSKFFIMVNYEGRPFEGKLFTRYELAIVTARALGRWQESPKAMEHLWDDEPQTVVAMGRLVREFRPELKQLGVDVNAVDAFTHPFTDVPTGHWAAGSVKKLRRQAIVIGYPDASVFRGNSR